MADRSDFDAKVSASDALRRDRCGHGLLQGLRANTVVVRTGCEANSQECLPLLQRSVTLTWKSRA
jgi:hypothetical protein